MEEKLWRFTDNTGTFASQNANQIRTLYFPLANERLMSGITPDLHGDIKTGQNAFLLTPVSRIDLVDSRSSRNFWIYINKDKVWPVTKNSQFNLEAGLLWHKITRENKEIGLRAEVLSFVPSANEPVEIMQVEVTNISSKRIEFIPTAAIPIYGRGANNLRDHRHVTSLLQRVILHKFGVIVKPTLIFDESGHQPNRTLYFVLGWDEKFNAPRYIYPTQEMFCGEAGDLEAPASVLEDRLPDKKVRIQGREAMAGLRFHKTVLGVGKSSSYIILMGIVENKAEIKNIVHKFKGLKSIKQSFAETKDFWLRKTNSIFLSTGNSDFDNWFRWVSIQPTLRRIFGCSFLPDFDYGRGGRGWRDLWQDCLTLILTNPRQVRKLLINNFSGVRINGSNATIIGKKEGEFISDRNNIARVWMDHGVWPLLTLDLYIHETGDIDILFAETDYFDSRQKGTILEHLLAQNLVQFFNVGSHNHIRLEGADWNDGLDMAKEFGESVAFSCMYAYNLGLLAKLLRKIGRQKISLARELKLLLGGLNYNNIKSKRAILERYLNKTKSQFSAGKFNIDTILLSEDLKVKSAWMKEHIRRTEWLRSGFFNGYYDNQKKRAEGIRNNRIRMMLASQVFPIMSGVAEDGQINDILENIQRHLFDRKLKGYRLNTDFRQEQPNFGRAFSFIYGDKENGAFFNHMAVMFAYALYSRGFVQEGWRVLKSIYDMAMDTAQSKIYPCLPEYFNLQGQGMYAYLTGSASWFVLTVLTECFGLKGKQGDLLIEPKLCREQFKHASQISIKRVFADRRLEVKFSNPKKLDFAEYKIIKADLNSRDLFISRPNHILIGRRIILGLPKNRLNLLKITLG